MPYRFLANPGLVVAVLALVVLASPLASAQAQTAASDAAGPLLTPWGDPDLQGIWNNFTITPLERPANLADQEFLSAEEAAALEQRAAEGIKRENAPSEVRTEPLPVGGNVGAYNSYWTEQGTRVVPTRRTSLIVDPPNGRLPNLTPEALARITSPEYRRLADAKDGRVPANGPEEMGLSERCLWYRGIPSFPTGYNNNYQIFQNREFVIILQEHIHDVRVIPLDGRPHLAPHVRQWAGSSRGRWDGDTLVVETTNLTGGVSGSSRDVRLVERFTRVGPERLQYEFTVDDPSTWTQPWTARIFMRPAPGTGVIYEYACHEGNYAAELTLRSTRAAEAAQSK